MSWLQSLTHKDPLSGVRNTIIVLILLENRTIFLFFMSLAHFFLSVFFLPKYLFTFIALLNLWCGLMHWSYICYCYLGEKRIQTDAFSMYVHKLWDLPNPLRISLNSVTSVQRDRWMTEGLLVLKRSNMFGKWHVVVD